jgi:hypothetical protein
MRVNKPASGSMDFGPGNFKIKADIQNPRITSQILVNLKKQSMF